MGTLNKKKMRGIAEAALAVVKYSSESTKVEAVLLTGLAGELQEQFEIEDSAAFSAAERLAKAARTLYALKLNYWL